MKLKQSNREAEIVRLHESCRDLLSLKPGWDSYDAPPPNIHAYENAIKLLDILSKTDLENIHVSPSAEGGIGIGIIIDDKRYIEVECSNTGEISLGHSSRSDDVQVYDLNLDDDGLEMLRVIDEFRQRRS